LTEELGVADTTTAVVDVWLTVCVITFDVVPLKLLSELVNVATTVWAPADANGAVHALDDPEVTVILHKVAEVRESVKVMVPFGWVPLIALKAAVKPTGWFTVEGFRPDERLMATEPGLILCANADDVLVAKLESLGVNLAVTLNVPAPANVYVHEGATPVLDRVTPVLHVPVGVAFCTVKETVPCGIAVPEFDAVTVGVNVTVPLIVAAPDEISVVVVASALTSCERLPGVPALKFWSPEYVARMGNVDAVENVVLHVAAG
jgi:hypothetical protein